MVSAPVPSSSSPTASSAPRKTKTVKRPIRRRGRGRPDDLSDEDGPLQREALSDSDISTLDSSQSDSGSDGEGEEQGPSSANNKNTSPVRSSVPSPPAFRPAVEVNPPFLPPTSTAWSDMVAVEQDSATTSDLPVLNFEDLAAHTHEDGSASVPKPTSSTPPVKNPRTVKKKAASALGSQPVPQPTQLTAERNDSANHAPALNGRSPKPSQRQAYLDRLNTDPSYVPRVGQFWGHDERLMDKDLRSMSGWWRGRWQGRGGARGRGRGRGGFFGASPASPAQDNADVNHAPVSASAMPHHVDPVERSWTHDGFEELRRLDSEKPRGSFRGRGRGARGAAFSRGGSNGVAPRVSPNAVSSMMNGAASSASQSLPLTEASNASVATAPLPSGSNQPLKGLKAKKTKAPKPSHESAWTKNLDASLHPDGIAGATTVKLSKRAKKAAKVAAAAAASSLPKSEETTTQPTSIPIDVRVKLPGNALESVVQVHLPTTPAVQSPVAHSTHIQRPDSSAGTTSSLVDRPTVVRLPGQKEKEPMPAGATHRGANSSISLSRPKPNSRKVDELLQGLANSANGTPTTNPLTFMTEDTVTPSSSVDLSESQEIQHPEPSFATLSDNPSVSVALPRSNEKEEKDPFVVQMPRLDRSSEQFRRAFTHQLPPHLAQPTPPPTSGTPPVPSSASYVPPPAADYHSSYVPPPHVPQPILPGGVTYEASTGRMVMLTPPPPSASGSGYAPPRPLGAPLPYTAPPNPYAIPPYSLSSTPDYLSSASAHVQHGYSSNASDVAASIFQPARRMSKALEIRAPSAMGTSPATPILTMDEGKGNGSSSASTRPAGSTGASALSDGETTATNDSMKPLTPASTQMSVPASLSSSATNLRSAVHADPFTPAPSTNGTIPPVYNPYKEFIPQPQPQYYPPHQPTYGPGGVYYAPVMMEYVPGPEASHMYPGMEYYGPQGAPYYPAGYEYDPQGAVYYQ